MSDQPIIEEQRQNPNKVDPNAPWSPDELQVPVTPDDIDAIRKELPLLDEVITWFDNQIADFLNPNVIQKVTMDMPAQDVKDAVMFAQKMSEGYSKKRNEFAARFKKYIAELTPKPPAE